uniref:SH3 domain-containing protein n=1 Tax=Echeneis naucrates TaxID=173247 RepID=A0A665T1M9_ECHNA
MVPPPVPSNGLGNGEGTLGQTAEPATPRPLSPTKLLPFLSNPHRNPSDADLEALRRRLHHAPRPLKKRSSITEPEGPAGPNIQKLLYQKTTLAAMETIPMGDRGPAYLSPESPEDPLTPPPLPPRSPNKLTPSLAAPWSILRKADADRITTTCGSSSTPLALLLDSSLEGESLAAMSACLQWTTPARRTTEGITALHNAVCAGHTEIVKFLVRLASMSTTPLHCAASCNNVQVCKFLVDDMQTAADKCEEMEEGYAQCSQFLYGVQEKMGVMNRGVVYALWDYEPQSDDELGFSEGDCMTVLKQKDEVETDWWWARCGDREGYIPRNLLGLYLRIRPRQRSLA